MITRSLPSPSELKALYPLTSSQKTFIESSRKTAKNILLKKDLRKLIVVGPCSVHDFELFLDYAKQLKMLTPEVLSSLFIVIRAYIEKPRTFPGFKGFVYQPFSQKAEDLELGLKMSRQLFIELTKLEIPISMEILEPKLFSYFDDLLTWGFIGARTSSSQIHREISSLASFPIGFKNSLDGNIDLAIQGAHFSRSPQRFFHIDDSAKLVEISSLGNPFTHIVLRGSNQGPNYDVDSLELAGVKGLEHGLKSPILIDCSHGNSQKDPAEQERTFLKSLDYLDHPNLLGLMLESHLEATSSKTDLCMDFETTKRLLKLAHSYQFSDLLA